MHDFSNNFISNMICILFSVIITKRSRCNFILVFLLKFLVSPSLLFFLILLFLLLFLSYLLTKSVLTFPSPPQPFLRSSFLSVAMAVLVLLCCADKIEGHVAALPPLLVHLVG